MSNDQQHSPSLVAALSTSIEVSEWIAEHHPKEVLHARRTLIAAPLYGICMEHREAILLLVDHNCRTSAFALWRPVYEALHRGLWAEYCLTESDIERLVKTQHLPKFDTMIKRLDALEPGSGNSSYSASKLKVWKSMSDFAHGGFAPLARWAGPDGLGARHPDLEVMQLLWRVDLFGLLACMAVNRLAGRETKEHEARIEVHLGAAK